jgi:uncharacterized protein YndB with AHSA1/START domain
MERSKKMEQRSVTHGTFVIERSYPKTPERVFAAFADPVKKRRWFADGRGQGVEEFEMDFRVGGNEKTSSRLGEGTPFPGTVLTNDTVYRDIVPNRRIVTAYSMSLGDRRISASLATFEFVATEEGTNLIFTDQGAYFEGADEPQRREAGWRELLEQLAKDLAR